MSSPVEKKRKLNDGSADFETRLYHAVTESTNDVKDESLEDYSDDEESCFVEHPHDYHKDYYPELTTTQIDSDTSLEDDYFVSDIEEKLKGLFSEGEVTVHIERPKPVLPPLNKQYIKEMVLHTYSVVSKPLVAKPEEIINYDELKNAIKSGVSHALDFASITNFLEKGTHETKNDNQNVCDKIKEYQQKKTEYDSEIFYRIGLLKRLRDQCYWYVVSIYDANAPFRAFPSGTMKLSLIVDILKMDKSIAQYLQAYFGDKDIAEMHRSEPYELVTDIPSEDARKIFEEKIMVFYRAFIGELLKLDSTKCEPVDTPKDLSSIERPFVVPVSDLQQVPV